MGSINAKLELESCESPVFQRQCHIQNANTSTEIKQAKHLSNITMPPCELASQTNLPQRMNTFHSAVRVQCVYK